MGEKNQVFSSSGLLENFNHHDKAHSKTNQLDLNLTLSIGESSSYATQPPPESEISVRTFSLNGKGYTAKYMQQDYNSSGQQQMFKSMFSDNNKGIRKLIQIPEEGDELEEGEIVEMRAKNGRIINWVVESVAKNTAFCRTMEKLNFVPGLESSNGANFASPYHHVANIKENEMKMFNYNRNGNNKNVKSTAYYPDKRPIISSGENGNPPKKIRASSFSDDVSGAPTPTMQLMTQMPSVEVMGPNGAQIEGVLFKWGSIDEIVIVCIDHFRFFSPVDFVRHAGWTDVGNPMHHIKVLAPRF